MIDYEKLEQRLDKIDKRIHELEYALVNLEQHISPYCEPLEKEYCKISGAELDTSRSSLAQQASKDWGKIDSSQHTPHIGAFATCCSTHAGGFQECKDEYEGYLHCTKCNAKAHTSRPCTQIGGLIRCEHDWQSVIECQHESDGGLYVDENWKPRWRCKKCGEFYK